MNKLYTNSYIINTNQTITDYVTHFKTFKLTILGVLGKVSPLIGSQFLKRLVFELCVNDT